MKHLGHSSKGEPFHQGKSKEFRKGYDDTAWGDCRQQQYDPGKCVLCKTQLVDGGMGLGIYCPNPECFNFSKEEEEYDESTAEDMS